MNRRLRNETLNDKSLLVSAMRAGNAFQVFANLTKNDDLRILHLNLAGRIRSE